MDPFRHFDPATENLAPFRAEVSRQVEEKLRLTPSRGFVLKRVDASDDEAPGLSIYFHMTGRGDALFGYRWPDLLDELSSGYMAGAGTIREAADLLSTLIIANMEESAFAGDIHLPRVEAKGVIWI